MNKLFNDGFWRNIVIVLLLTIMLGSLISSGIGWAANFYFGQTLQSLIGDMGEYDLIISVRQPMKDVAKEKMAEIVVKEMPGLKWKEGTPLPGKVNLFLSFPEKYKTREVWENLDRYFGSIPGKSGYTIMLEPRLTIRAIPGGAQNFLLAKLESFPEVEFAFKDGSSLQLVLKSNASVPEVNSKVKELLSHYQLFTVYFPLGYQPNDIQGLGNKLAKELQQEFSLTVSRNVAFSSQDQRTADFNATLGEMKSFLLAYSSQVTVKLLPESQVTEKDNLEVGRETSLQVQEINGHQAKGIVIRGKADRLLGEKVYRQGQEVGQVVGIDNPKEKLQHSLTESISLLSQLEEIRIQALSGSKKVLAAIEDYQQIVPQVETVRDKAKVMQDQMENNPVNLSIDLSPLEGRLNEIDRKVSEVQNVLNQYQGQIKSQEKQLDAVRDKMGPQIPESILTVLESLEKGYQNQTYLVERTKDKLENIREEVAKGKQTVNTLGQIGKISKFKDTLQDTADSLDKLVILLNGYPADDLTNQVKELDNTLSGLEKVDEKKIISSLKYLQETLPTLEDQQMGSSITLMDEYTNKQISTDQGLIIMTDNWLPQGPAEKKAQEIMQNKGVSSLKAPLGMVETDMRGEIQRIISSIRQILAALSAIVFTLFILILDQTTIMSTLRMLEEKQKVWWSPAHAYGSLVGSLVLTAILLISKGAIPYLYLGHYLIIGAALGYITAHQSVSLSPVNQKEITAGEALGLNYREIMEQIVIPSSKPGLLRLCNKNKVKFLRGKSTC